MNCINRDTAYTVKRGCRIGRDTVQHIEIQSDTHDTVSVLQIQM